MSELYNLDISPIKQTTDEKVANIESFIEDYIYNDDHDKELCTIMCKWVRTFEKEIPKAKSIDDIQKL